MSINNIISITSNVNIDAVVFCTINTCIFKKSLYLSVGFYFIFLQQNVFRDNTNELLICYSNEYIK